MQAQWVAQLSAKTEKYKNETVPEYYKLIAENYAKGGGPFLLGSKVTYADFAVYQSIDNDAKIGTLPVSLELFCLFSFSVFLICMKLLTVPLG